LRVRQVFKEFAIYGVADIILRAASFFTLPIYTRLFTPEDYGIWSFVMTTVGLVSGVLALGGDSAYARFFFEAKTLREKQIITSTWIGFLGLWSLAVVVVCLPFTGLFSHWSFGVTDYGLLFVLALWAAPLTLINGLCGQVLRNQFRASLFASLNTLTTLLSIGLSLVAVLWLRLGIAGLMIGALAAALVMLPIRLWTARALLRPRFSWRQLGQLLAYGVPLVPVSIAYWVFVASDRLVLGKLSTLEQVGLYTVANNLTSTLTFINSALGQAWSPHAIRAYEDQRAAAPALFGRVMTYILLGFGLLCVVITAFAHEALILLSTPPFYGAAVAVGPLAFAMLALASTQVTALSISLVKKTHYLSLYSWLAALLNLGLNLWLVPRWGMIAASWSTAGAYLFLTLGYLVTSQRLWPVAYETRRALTITALTLLFTILAAWAPTLPLLVSIPLKVGYVLLYVGALVALGALDHAAWRRLRTLISGKVGALVQTRPSSTEAGDGQGAAS
jgi:O-antigen/teichoic acid export membrane protein